MPATSRTSIVISSLAGRMRTSSSRTPRCRGGTRPSGPSSTKKTTTAVPVAPQCPAHFPPVIHDGFPEPQIIFSHAGVLNASLRMTLANVTQNGVTYDTGMEYNRQLPGPTLVFCPGDLV